MALTITQTDEGATGWAAVQQANLAAIKTFVDALETDLAGFPAELKNLTAAEIQQLENIGAVTIAAAAWGHVGAMDQDVATTDKPEFAGLELTDDLDAGDNDLTEVKNILPHDGDMDIVLPLPGTVKIKGTEGNFDAETVFICHFDGADGATEATDESITPHDITFVANAQLDTAEKKFGTASVLFDGWQDAITLADHADWNFGNGKFTIDFQLHFNVVPGVVKCLILQQNGTWWEFYCDGTKLHFLASDQDPIVTGNWVPVVNTTYHIALIRGWNGNANDWAITVDGVAIATNTLAYTMLDVGGLIEIGGNHNAAAQTPEAFFDEFRISKGIARWTANFTPPTEAYSPVLSASHLEVFSDLKVDTIDEHTADAGVTIEGVLIKDGLVDSVDVAALETDVDGFPDELKNLTAAEISQLENIGAVTIAAGQWGYLGDMTGRPGMTHRGDPAANDFTVGDFTTDGGTYDLDLSGVVPAGAKTALLKITLEDDAVASYIQITKNGFSNWPSANLLRTIVANVPHDDMFVVPLDGDRKAQYRATNTVFTTITITVVGWWFE